MSYRGALSLTAVCLVIALAGYTTVWHEKLPAVTPGQTGFPSWQVARGAELAAVGDCEVCHSASGGQPYAGGRGVPTPFGTVYATNITPDLETGIGTWSEAAFRRAMRAGIDRDGRHLYPVLPYPHFTRATDDDIAAMYAFLMTRQPIRQAAPPNRLPFPLNYRVLLAGWNLLYLAPGPLDPDPAHDADWNRGAYLVQAIGHCGACHSPRNALGAETSSHALAGGQAEGWYAPPLQGDARPWTADAMAAYLRTGYQAQHGAAAGPMTAVTDALAGVPDQDVRAMAVYVSSLTPKTAPPPAPPRPAADRQSRALFEGACSGCHAADAAGVRGADAAGVRGADAAGVRTSAGARAGTPLLTLSNAVNAPTADSMVHIILNGIPWREGKAAPYMPGFGDALTDAQITDLAVFIRATFSDKPAWTEVATNVAKARGKL
jgi:mono/diheme cytochrome c family protein